GNDDFVVAQTAEEALSLAQQKSGNAGLTLADLRQDEDVLDTWFSAWLWPISVFNGINEPENEEINYYYPTQDLVTAPDIIFFWVARMIVSGYEFRGQLPFENVYFTGIVRDKLGRKMSKSLGNSPDPIDLMNEYGADATRMGMLLTAPAGNDLPFDVELCVQGRNFANKIWNAFRLVKGLEIIDAPASASDKISAVWFDARFNQALTEIEENFKHYRLSDALMTTYKLVWDDFCAWYLELVKPTYGSPIASETLEMVKSFFQRILTLVHPFMPFLTEELWHDELFGIKEEKDCIIVAEFPKVSAFDEQVIKDFAVAQQIISEVRNIRNSKGISPKVALPLAINQQSDIDLAQYIAIITKIANLEAVTFVTEKVAGATSFLAGKDECYVLLENNIDVDAERERIEKELDYLKGFLVSVDKKLSNERFVQNAKPEIVENEKSKKADAEAKIKILQDSLATLG
ncbi:MAG: class I tRNA ligase family protein, partial [Sphingobacterium sp.]